MEAKQLRTTFREGGFKFKDDGLVSRCAALASEHGLNAQTMLTKFEAWMMSAGMESTITAQHLDVFKAHLAKTATKDNKSRLAKGLLGRQSWEDLPDTPEPTPKRRATENSNVTAATTPVADPRIFTPQSAGTFSERQNRGQVVSALNGPLPEVAAAVAGAGACRVDVQGAEFPTPFRFMTETVGTKVAAIDDRIVRFAAAFKEATGLDASSSVNEITQDPVVVVGRIVCDAAEGGQLNEQSVLLEGCRHFSQGGRVRLDLSQLPAFRLFPGQVVAARGMNPSSHTFIAQQLWTHIPAPVATPPPPEADAAAPVSAVVAVGPFTTSADVSYQPLAELLQYCTAAAPGLLLLVGPFVDEEQPLVKAGLLDITFQALFEQQVLGKLRSWQQQNRGTTVVLQPSLRDAHHLPVFPTPAFTLPAADGPSSAAAAAGGDGDGRLLQTVPSPATLVLSPHEGNAPAAARASLAVLSHDALRHLSVSEISRQPAGAPPADRMLALASHLVGQRSFYPLYPPPPGACLDTTFDAALVLPATPDVLVVPSDLAPFAKCMEMAQFCGSSGQAAAAAAGDSDAQHAVATAVTAAAPSLVTVINPGRLTKGPNAGTFAHIVFGGAATGQGEAAAATAPHQRVHVEVKRI